MQPRAAISCPSAGKFEEVDIELDESRQGGAADENGRYRSMPLR